MVYLSRIYTKSGDGGETGLGDGTRVAKDDPRVIACGEVDELNAVLGIAIAFSAQKSLLSSVQNDLFDVGADLCVPVEPNQATDKSLRVVPSQIERLEREIDRLNERLEPIRSFVLPGGSPESAWLHLARTVCRRAERSVVTLCRTASINPNVLIYLNRLSDLLFVMARIANNDGRTDVLWVPGQSRNE